MTHAAQIAGDAVACMLDEGNHRVLALHAGDRTSPLERPGPRPLLTPPWDPSILTSMEALQCHQIKSYA